MIFAVEQKGEMMDDLISRQAAIDAVEESRRLNHHEDGKEACCHEYEHRHFLKILYELPSAQPETNCSEIPNNSDLISRQAVIDLLKQMRKDGDMVPWEGKDVFARIRKLPSVQPEPCEDTISRNAVIDAVKHAWAKGLEPTQYIEDLPSAQPERKKGRWIPVDSYSAFGGDEATWMAHGNPVAFYYCSECKEQAYAGEDGEPLLTAYCPNCGADMRGEQDE